MDNNAFQIGQLTKELVALKLKELQNPCAVAAGLVKDAIAVACKARPQEARTVVSDACYGGMQGLLLADQDLARGAEMILGAVSEAAADASLDPTELMSYGLAGVARIAKFVTRERLVAIQSALEERFQGCGEAFSAALAQEAGQKASQL